MMPLLSKKNSHRFFRLFTAGEVAQFVLPPLLKVNNKQT